jgi:glycine betaine/choline ABC-type transport system substrate-binding protein
VLSGPPECAEREDCLLGLEQVYGLSFREFLPVEIAARHTPLVEGTADVGLVFTTDGQIRSEGLVLLEDDQDMLPAYNVSLLVRDDVLDAAGPDLAEIADAVQEDLTTSVMQELNARVDLDQETPRSVARQYLRQTGFVP